MSDDTPRQDLQMLPLGIHGAATILAGYFGAVELGGGVKAMPAEIALRDGVEAEWRDETAEWWLLLDDDREYGYVPLGRREWASARQLVWKVHHEIESAEEQNVHLDEGVRTWFEHTKNAKTDDKSGFKGGFA